MKFEEALEQFAVELEKQYGKGDCIVKIALTPEVFREVMRDLSEVKFVGQTSYYNIDFGSFGEVKINNILLLQRERDNF